MYPGCMLCLTRKQPSGAARIGYLGWRWQFCTRALHGPSLMGCRYLLVCDPASCIVSCDSCRPVVWFGVLLPGPDAARSHKTRSTRSNCLSSRVAITLICYLLVLLF
jgi:hypothetical protein